MSVLDDLLKKHRKRIIDREEAAFRELLGVYRDLQQDLRSQFKAIEKMIADARAAGEEISPSWISRSRRLQSLIDQVKTEIVRFGGKVTGVVAREQNAAIAIAAEQTAETVRVMFPTQPVGSMLTPRVVENAVGMMGDGSPMIAYFEKTFAPAVAERLRSEIVKAVATGTDFRTIARRLMSAGDITRSRALTMARTEVNRVRRATTLQIYRERPDVITGWEWVASKSPRTCPVCLALDGRIFPLKDSFPQHINCRCTMIAVIDGVTRPPRELGPEWFDRQTDEIKEMIIGKDGLAAYKEGIISLKDFIGWKNSKEFGKSVYTKKLSDILMNKPVAAKVIRTPRNVELVTVGNGVRMRIRELTGQTLTDNQIGGMVGALDGAKVHAGTDGDTVYFRVIHPLIARQDRSLGIDDEGRVYMHNAYLRKSRTAPSSIGLKSFATQVVHARRYGIEYIDTYAAGNFVDAQRSDGFVGYYVWPRAGYNAKLTEQDWARFPRAYRGIPDLNALFLQFHGKWIWKRVGTDRNMVFDMDEERSWQILKAYLQENDFEVRFE